MKQIQKKNVVNLFPFMILNFLICCVFFACYLLLYSNFNPFNNSILELICGEFVIPSLTSIGIVIYVDKILKKKISSVDSFLKFKKILSIILKIIVGMLLLFVLSIAIYRINHQFCFFSNCSYSYFEGFLLELLFRFIFVFYAFTRAIIALIITVLIIPKQYFSEFINSNKKSS